MKIKLTINYNEEFDGSKFYLDFNCEEHYVFNDLYEYIDNEFHINDDKECRHVGIKKENEELEPINNFEIIKFIHLNNLNADSIIMNYTFAGRGAGEYLNDKLKIEIRAAENNHGESAHIHISNCKGEYQVVFSLLTLEIIDGKKNWEKTFNRKEKKKIEIMLKKYQNEFQNFYDTQLKGVVPDSISFEYDKKTYYLSYDNKTQ